MFYPTTTVTVLAEETGEDAYGDPIDVYKAVRFNLPAHIWEESQLVNSPATGQATTVRTMKGVVSDATQLKSGERLKDENSGAVYVIEHVRILSSPFSGAPQQIEMSLVS